VYWPDFDSYHADFLKDEPKVSLLFRGWRTKMAGVQRGNDMTNSSQRGLPMVLALVLVLATLAPAQTFATLYSFTDGPDGSTPMVALLQDKAGNLYGTTFYGGSHLYWSSN
jgi:hypothetical protein